MGDNKKLRIVLVTNNYTPYSGGVVSSIDALTTQLMACGYEVFIITLDFLGNRHDDPPHVIRVPSVVRFRYKSNHMTVPLMPSRYLLGILKKLKPTVVHVQHPFFLGEYALKAARMLSIPCIFTYHTIYEQYAYYIPFYQPIVRSIVRKKVLSFCRRVDHIIAPSCAIRDYLLQQKITTPVTIIPSGLLPLFLPTTSIDKSDRFERHDPFRLLLVSRFVKEKNIPFLFDVVAKLDPKKVHLIVAGYGQEEFFLKQYAYDVCHLSQESVQFMIRPDKKTLARLYKQADLFLFSSTSDTQGLVLAEAMGGDTPVVALDGPGQRDIIKNDYNGFLVTSSEQMITKIEQIINDKDLLERLKAGARATALQYNPVKLTERIISVYQNV